MRKKELTDLEAFEIMHRSDFGDESFNVYSQELINMVESDKAVLECLRFRGD